MSQTPPDTDAALAAVRADEVLPLEALKRRFGWGQKTIKHAKDEGLLVIPFGRHSFVRGSDIIDLFNRLAENEKGR